jgi:hypothetical protein
VPDNHLHVLVRLDPDVAQCWPDGDLCLAVAATALAIWWLTSLNRLPDIGDPFDVAAFRTFHLPDDRNAFTFFRRAWKAVEPNIDYLPGSSETIPKVP